MRRLTATLTLATSLLGTTCLGAFAQTTAPVQPAPAQPASTGCTGPVDPYTNYACLDTYLGSSVTERLFNYYKLEWGQAGAPTDPNAPAQRQAGWPDTPETTPPMPFTEWPYGGVTSIGVTRPNSVDSPLMTAIANTSLGKWMQENHFQVYGWVDGGANLSSNTVRPGGNSPISYTYTPNTVQLDQTVIYLDRFPDTVQTDHIDWGLRLSAIYGENYRYTTSYGLASYQLLKRNQQNGYDFPMLYGELWIPQIAQGLMLRLGRYISVPDIEAQLAPNNYMYTHSLMYSFDNYTNEGLQGSLQITPNLLLQLGVNIGTESTITNVGAKIPNPYPNPLYPGSTYRKDPGATPSFTACLRYDWNSGKDTIYPCADGINSGKWGYNNLQWYGFTYYHKFNDHWHISTEFYDLHENGVPNVNNPDVQAIIAAGGTPFSPQNVPFNAPNGAHCSNSTVLRCNAYAMGAVAYINYSPDPLNNFSLRPEIYEDAQGQRTGTKATYYEITFGWQHWLSPQIEMRPEIGYYHSNGGNAFNGQTRNYTWIAAGDVIVHF
jgi:hypothetical protein